MILRLVALCCCVVYAEIHGDLPPQATRGIDEKATRIPVSDGATLDIYQKWVDTGLSSLMAAVANKRLKRHRRNVITKFGECSRVADSVPLQARCVSKLLKNQIHSDADEPKKQIQRLSRYGKKDSKDWTGAFRMRAKRESRTVKTNYDLHSTKELLSPLGGVAKFLMESVLAAKNKTKVVPWQQTVSKLKENGAKKRKMRKELEDESEESNDQMAFRGLRKHLMKQEQGDIDADELFDDPKKITEMIKKVSKKKNKKPLEKLLQLVRDGVKLGYSLSGQNTTNFENKTMKLISPRFLGVVPEEQNDDEVDFLSPSLFSLHNEGSGLENLTSLPNLLRDMTLHDQQHWLNLIMEAAGVNDESDKLEKDVKEVQKSKQRRITTPGDMIDDDGVPIYFTKENATKIGGTFEERKIKTFELLHKSYTKEQLREMNTTGYAMLRKDQMDMLYGEREFPSSLSFVILLIKIPPYNNTDKLKSFKKMSEEQMHDFVEKDIHSLSEIDKFNIRQKDIVLSPIAFTWLVLVPGLASQPLILSPVIFSPLILSPSVFGAVILSPWMFVPLVLAPRVLGALILSPFILSPLVLHPGILSPGVLNPLILSPLVLVPLILSPQVFTPIILSPLVLSPFILNPVVGSPLILSPFVLSPIIGSPNALGALILSPYALSPVLFSPLIAFAAILSPSWLS